MCLFVGLFRGRSLSKGLMNMKELHLCQPNSDPRTVILVLSCCLWPSNCLLINLSRCFFVSAALTQQLSFFDPAAASLKIKIHFLGNLFLAYVRSADKWKVWQRYTNVAGCWKTETAYISGLKDQQQAKTQSRLRQLKDLVSVTLKPPLTRDACPSCCTLFRLHIFEWRDPHKDFTSYKWTNWKSDHRRKRHEGTRTLILSQNESAFL